MNADRATIDLRRCGLHAWREVHETWGDCIIAETEDTMRRTILPVVFDEVAVWRVEAAVRSAS